MRDIFTELAVAWDGDVAVHLASRPVPDRQFVPVPGEEPSSPPGGPSWFEVLTHHWVNPDAGMTIAVEAHQRDLARAAQAPVLNVSVGEPSGTRYQVDAEHGVVAYTSVPLRPGPAPGSRYVPRHRVRPRPVAVRHRPRPGLPVALSARLDRPAGPDDASTEVIPAVPVTDVTEAWGDWYDR